MTIRFLFFITLLTLSVCQTEDADGITVLDQTNFHKFIRSNENIFMFFHSSWDSRSKSFEYEYRLLAREVKEKGLDVKLAKINLPSNREIAEIYHIRQFPSLHFYQDGDDTLYDGRQNKRDILFYLEKKLNDDKYVIITDGKDVKPYIGKQRAVVVAHFKDNKTVKYKFFDNALCDNEDVEILVGFGDTDMGIKQDSFVIFNYDGEMFPFESKWESETIRKWVYFHSFPVVINYDNYWKRFVFSGKHDLNALIIYMSEEYDLSFNKELYEDLYALGMEYMGKAFVINMQADAGDMINYFGFEREALPLFFYVDMSGDVPMKYVYYGEFEREGMLNFVKEAQEGILYPFYRSEQIHEHLDGFVKVLVTREFDDIVYDPMKNVLVEFVVPGCRMCERVEDDYQKLAQEYIYREDILIARIDTTKNDLKDLLFPDFPAFILFKAGGDGEKRAVFSKDHIDYAKLKEFVETNRVPVYRSVEKKVEEKKIVEEEKKVEEKKIVEEKIVEEEKIAEEKKVEEKIVEDTVDEPTIKLTSSDDNVVQVTEEVSDEPSAKLPDSEPQAESSHLEEGASEGVSKVETTEEEEEL